jgi:hypothetical protein
LEQQKFCPYGKFKKICRMGKIFAAPAKYSAYPAKFILLIQLNF